MNKLRYVGFLKAFFPIAFLGSVLVGPAFAAFDMGQQSLQGLEGAQIIVRKLPPKIEKAGLKKENIQQNVQKKFEEADIKALNARECLFAPGAPSLDIDVKVFPLDDEADKSFAYFYSIEVSLTQGVFLARDSKINLHADTWTAQDYGQTASLEDVQEKVDGLIGKFIGAYKAANDPVKPAPVPPKTQEEETNLPPLEEK